MIDYCDIRLRLCGFEDEIERERFRIERIFHNIVLSPETEKRQGNELSNRTTLLF